MDNSLCVSVPSVGELQGVLQRSSGLEQSLQHHALHTFEGDRRQGNKAVVIEDRRRGFIGDMDDIRGLPDGGDVTEVQRHLEHSREDWGKRDMTVLEHSSKNLMRAACTALANLLKAPTHLHLLQNLLSVLLARLHLLLGSSVRGEVDGVKTCIETVEIIGQLPQVLGSQGLLVRPVACHGLPAAPQ